MNATDLEQLELAALSLLLMSYGHRCWRQRHYLLAVLSSAFGATFAGILLAIAAP